MWAFAFKNNGRCQWCSRRETEILWRFCG